MRYLIQEYAQKDGKTVHIDSVKQGLDCKCICPVCGEPLIARKGGMKAHHFAHTRNTKCTGTHEHNLKHVCRDAFEENRSFQVEMPVQKKGKLLDTLKQITIRVKKAIVGSKNEEEPDITLYTNVGKVYIEVTDDDERVEKFRDTGVPTIKCDVNRHVRASGSNEQFKELFIKEIAKETLYAKPVEEETETVEQKHKRLVRELKIRRAEEKQKMQNDKAACLIKKQKEIMKGLLDRKTDQTTSYGGYYDIMMEKLRKQINGGENV